MNKIQRITILSLLLLCISTARADEDYKVKLFNPVRTAATSQMIAPDARSAGMGDVGAATEADAVSQYWNPAKYPFAISRSGVALSYTPWLRQLVNDIGLAYLAGYYRIGDYSAISGSVRYFSLGEVTTITKGGGTGLTIKPYEMSVDVAYSLMLPACVGSTPTSLIATPTTPRQGRPLPLISDFTIRTTSTLVSVNVSWVLE